MTTINDFKKDDVLNHSTRGDGRVLKVTPRTITVKWKHSTQKISFKQNNAPLELSDF
jgi:hypothetical protein